MHLPRSHLLAPMDHHVASSRDHPSAFHRWWPKRDGFIFEPLSTFFFFLELGDPIKLCQLLGDVLSTEGREGFGGDESNTKLDRLFSNYSLLEENHSPVSLF